MFVDLTVALWFALLVAIPLYIALLSLRLRRVWVRSKMGAVLMVLAGFVAVGYVLSPVIYSY